MAAANILLSEDHLLCSICLDVFTDPVSTPCGHNFCKSCITQHWDVNVIFKCPICKKTFNTRPELQVNTFVSEMADRFRQAAQQEASSCSAQQAAKPGDVPCDVCSGTKLKALKSCLVCLVSFCQTHLEPHLTAAGLKRHQLMDPVEDLAGRICTQHDKPLELFCKTDQTCVCMLCTVLDHKAHDVVPLKDEHERKKTELGKTGVKLQQMIQERQRKIQDFKHSVKVSREDADREIAGGVQVFTELKKAVERLQAQVIKVTEEKHRRTQRQAEGFIKDLEQEISELKKRHAELEQLSHSEDHLHLVQKFPSLNAAPPTRDWKVVRVHPPLHVGTVRTAVAQRVELLKDEMNKRLIKAEVKTVQRYAVNVTLDPDSAHPELTLSEDGKQMCLGLVRKNLPDNPERFSIHFCAVGKQAVSSGRIYFEVQVQWKTSWVLGVCRESINRKEGFKICPENGLWTVGMRNENEYRALADPPVCLPLRSKPEKVGVFVDYEEGLVSFYDVDAAALIYSFTGCNFARRLLPLFCPGLNQVRQNSAPLIICPVNRT